MSDYFLKSVNKEHSRNQGYHRIYVSFPFSKANSKHPLLSPEAFSGWVSDTVKADIYFTDYSLFNIVSYDDLNDAFEDIELVVALVDKEYLDSNPINELEIEVANDKMIPILPILLEPQHIDTFNTKFLHKQCITYKNKKDHTVFLEQLEQYIYKHLEGGMSYDINEIENIFTSPIFLSYRKKDKAHLKEFLEELHLYDDLKPYSFWYDDFLNPGNNYDEEIKEILDKSNIFILFITKNIFEEGNYVLDIEYPYALKHNKKIIGVLAKNVSKKLATSTFKEISTFYKVDDFEGITNELFTLLEEHKINDAYHKFLLAQAYYYGIGVEKNKDIAFDLFSTSFDEGENRSCKYLANSYFTNDMSCSNILGAISHQKTYIDFISGKGVNFKQNIEEKRLLTKYLIASHNLEEASIVALNNLNECEFDTGFYFDCFLDNIEVLLNMVSLKENTIKLLDKYKDELLPYDKEQDDLIIIRSLRLSYLYALYYYNLGLLDEASSYISNYQKVIYLNHIFSYGENAELVAKTLFLTAKIFEELNLMNYANKCYSDAFVFASFEKSLNLSFIADISLYKISLFDSLDEKEELIESYIATTSSLASEDRTRFDYLHAYFLIQSNTLENYLKASYLLERYTQIDINSFIKEKIDLYQKMFVYFCENPQLELNNDNITPFEMRAYSYYLNDDMDIVENTVLKEIFLRTLINKDDEEILIKLEILKLIEKQRELNEVPDYRQTHNNEFFLSRDEEESAFPIEGTSEDLSETMSLFDDFDDFDDFYNN